MTMTDDIKVYKEKQFIIFEFEDGKTVKYNLATKEMIGKNGKPVNDLKSQLKGFNVYKVIDLFEDENYKKYLRFLLRNFVNDKRSCWYRTGEEVDRVKNVGTFLSKIGDHAYFEQYFAAGIDNVDPNVSYTLNEVPKQLIKIIKEYNLLLDKSIVRSYNDHAHLFDILMTTELRNFNKDERINLFKGEDAYPYSCFYRLIKDYNYNPVSLLQYVDNLITYEGLDYQNTFREVYDYARMMKTMSPKYEKYPKYFLTSHKIASRNYQRLMTQFSEQLFINRIDLTMEWKYNGFKFIYPKCSQDIKDEATQQSNCVASYIKSVLNGECHILFMRSVDNEDQSLVTLEVRDNKVVQAKGRYNRNVTREEQEVIDKYNNYLVRRLKQSKLNVVGEVVIC